MKRIGLVSCVKSKRSHAAPARDLYVSPYFQKMRHHVERTCDDWRILSAKHGLLKPDDVIHPYEETLKTKSREEQRGWAHRVYGALTDEFPAPTIFELHAGTEYARDLASLLQAAGHVVEQPLKGLSIGYRLQFYGQVGSGGQAPAPTRSVPRTIQAPITAHSPRARQTSFADEIARILAESVGLQHVDINAGQLHRRVGGYPGPSHRMPACCVALRAAMQENDAILDSPPSGNGARLTIRFTLPRRNMGARGT